MTLGQKSKGSPLNEAIHSLLADWSDRNIEKPRGTLPLKETAAGINYIRRIACKSAGIVNCSCWELVPSVNADSGATALVGVDEEAACKYVGPGPSEPEATNPCHACRTPGVSKKAFSIAVFGENVIEKEDDGARIDPKVFLRPMGASTYYKVIAAAFANGWLTFGQASAMMEKTAEVEAASAELRPFLKRLRARVTYRNSGVISDDPRVLLDRIAEAKTKITEQMIERGKEAARRRLAHDETLQDWLLATKLPQDAS